MHTPPARSVLSDDRQAQVGGYRLKLGLSELGHDSTAFSLNCGGKPPKNIVAACFLPAAKNCVSPI